MEISLQYTVELKSRLQNNKYNEFLFIKIYTFKAGKEDEKISTTIKTIAHLGRWQNFQAFLYIFCITLKYTYTPYIIWPFFQ